MTGSLLTKLPLQITSSEIDQNLILPQWSTKEEFTSTLTTEIKGVKMMIEVAADVAEHLKMVKLELPTMVPLGRD